MNNREIPVRDQEFLAALRETILKNLQNEQFSVSQLGRQVGYSRSQLHRKLKGLEGKSTSQFIREVRLDEAMRLLIAGAGTSAEIAYQVGFSSPTYFNRCFRERYGCVPSKVRKQKHLNGYKSSKTEESKNTGTIRSQFSASGHKGLWQISVTGLFLIGLAVIFFRFDFFGSNRPIAIAVLPLENLSHNPENEFFTAGMHDALIGALGKISALRVISRTSTLPYSGGKRDLGEIAKRLGVDIVIEGSVYGYGDSVRLQLQLIKVFPKEQHIWAKEYHQALAHSLKLHSSATTDIAQQIKVQLNPDEALRMHSTRMVNPEMYRAFMRGMYFLNRSTPEDFQRGIDFLNQAIALDPGDPLAYAQLALGYITMGHGPDPVRSDWQRAKAAALRSISLDSSLAESHAALAIVKSYFDRDWEGAEREFRKAHRLNPSLAIAHFHYAWFLALFNRFEEAEKENLLAKELDPLTPIYTADLGTLYHWMGDHDRAMLELELALELDRNFSHAWWTIGNCHLAKAQYDQAILAHQKAVEINPSWSWALANTYVESQQKEKAMPIIDSLKSEPITSRNAIGLAMIYANLGDLTAAFHWLGHTPSDFWVPWMRAWPGFKHLKVDPRFDDFLQRFRLPPVS